MKLLQFEDLGSMRYKPCWDYQEKSSRPLSVEKLIGGMPQMMIDLASLPVATSRLLFVEHPHVLTLEKKWRCKQCTCEPIEAS